MKGLKLLLLTFATLAITACSDDTTDEWHGDFGSIQVPDTRQLSQKIPAGQTAGNSEIFFSTNDAWNSAITDESRAEAPTWVRINHGDAAGDYDIRVETDPNTAEESRTAFIEITCGTNSILITITQSGTDGEDTNEPDEPNIGEQVRYWQLHKIVGRDASGSLIAEMEYTYELPAEFSKECRITGFKISAADKNGTLRPVETWQFTYEGDDCIRFSFTREIDGEQPYTQTADGTLYGYFCDVRSGGYELTSTLSGSEIETYGFDCTYGTDRQKFPGSLNLRSPFGRKTFLRQNKVNPEDDNPQPTLPATIKESHAPLRWSVSSCPQPAQRWTAAEEQKAV